MMKARRIILEFRCRVCPWWHRRVCRSVGSSLCGTVTDGEQMCLRMLTQIKER